MTLIPDCAVGKFRARFVLQPNATAKEKALVGQSGQRLLDGRAQAANVARETTTKPARNPTGLTTEMRIALGRYLPTTRPAPPAAALVPVRPPGERRAVVRRPNQIPQKGLEPPDVLDLDEAALVEVHEEPLEG